MILSTNIQLISYGPIPFIIPIDNNKYNLFVVDKECERYELEYKVLTRFFKFNKTLIIDYISQLDNHFYITGYNGIMSITNMEPWK